ncbi:MAG: hypothetical protein CMN55_07665 [Sneathiella sp.]|jgi:hypothetical protein|uniref:heme-dependent oxidative N-demethylase family protein n=1 Tax=Sneathiella sp. TaxID=1964365 RepID=UPI000C5582E2|nr:DUF3445 domain-containing protein [Sneathiella sp.]MAL78979.1 hypothetical protein [Sneathiella sp.]
MSLRYFPLDGADFRLTMGLQALRERSWIEPDHNYHKDISGKQRLLRIHREKVYANLPQTDAAEADILSLVQKELAQFHPTLIPPAVGQEEKNALVRAALMVQEDLVLMRDGGKGDYLLAAAAVFAPTGWDLAEKIGRPMRFIHAPVPELNARIGSPIDRFFRNLKPGKKVERFNWGLYDSDAPFQPAWWRKERTADPDISVENIGRKLFFRVERQTLQRLPGSSDILFTIRVFSNPLAHIAEDKHRAACLLRALETMERDMRRYKSIARYEKELRTYLGAPSA